MKTYEEAVAVRDGGGGGGATAEQVLATVGRTWIEDAQNGQRVVVTRLRRSAHCEECGDDAGDAFRVRVHRMAFAARVLCETCLGGFYGLTARAS